MRKRNLPWMLGLAGLIFTVFLQTGCSTNDVKILGSEEEIYPDPSPPFAGTTSPVSYEKKKVDFKDSPKIRDASNDGTTLSKKPNTNKGTQRDQKTPEVLNEVSKAVDELHKTNSEVSRLPSRSKALNVAADNTRINRLQDGDPRLSADQQGNSLNDIAITSKIRRSIIRRSDLSVYAQNVKIITRDGYVVLKGPVRSEAEREIVENTAAEVAGIENVVSGIGVVTGER